MHQYRKGEGLTEKNSNENLETPQLAPALFSHLPGFYLKTGILNPSPFLHNPKTYWLKSISTFHSMIFKISFFGGVRQISDAHKSQNRFG